MISAARLASKGVASLEKLTNTQIHAVFKLIIKIAGRQARIEALLEEQMKQYTEAQDRFDYVQQVGGTEAQISQAKDEMRRVERESTSCSERISQLSDEAGRDFDAAATARFNRLFL